MIDYTTVIGVDRAHLVELAVNWPIWMALKPDLREHPVIFVCDAAVGSAEHWRRLLSFIDHPNAGIQLAYVPELRAAGATQREIMLTALFIATAGVQTEWYLKLDTDTRANDEGPVYKPEWFEGDPVFVSHRWGFTRPASLLLDVEAWAATQPDLAANPPPVPNLNPKDRERRVRHPRVISFCMFGRRDFTLRAWARLPPGPIRLPSPSQDTFLWYVAHRGGEPYRRVNVGEAGWCHRRVGREERLEAKVKLETVGWK